MTLTLASLPGEIISTHIVRHLSAVDVVSLIQCINFPVSETLYRQCFPKDPHFAHYDAKMLRERALAKFCYIESPESSILTSHSHKRVHRPLYDVIDVEEPVAQVAIGHSRLVFVTQKGEMYNADLASGMFGRGTGTPIDLLECDHLSGGGDDYDEEEYESMKMAMEENLNSDNNYNSEDGWESDEYLAYELDPNHNRAPPPGVMELSDKFFAKPRNPPRFVQACIGDCVLALDSEGIPWLDDCNKGSMVPFCLTRKGTKSTIKEKVVKVGYEHGRILFLLEDGVLASCPTCDQHGKDMNNLDPNGYRSGYACFDGHLCYIDVEEDTGGATDSFFLTSGVLVFLARKGTVESVYADGDSIEEYDNAFMIDNLEGVNAMEPYKFMTGCQRWAYLITKDEKVVCVDTYESEEGEVVPRVVKGLEDLRIVSIVVGSGRCLLLTEKKDVYWFPLELNSEQVKDNEVVVTPEHLELPGNAYGLFSENGFAGVLAYGKNE